MVSLTRKITFLNGKTIAGGAVRGGRFRADSDETAESGLFLPRLHLVPRRVEGFEDALDGAFQGLVEHLVPVDVELLGHLVGELEADDVWFLLELPIQSVFF